MLIINNRFLTSFSRYFSYGSRNFCPSALTVNAGENPKVLSKDEPKENGKRRKGAQGLTPGLYFLGFLEQELFLYLFEIYYVLSSIPFSLQRLVFWHQEVVSRISPLSLGVKPLSREGNSQTGDWMLHKRRIINVHNLFLFQLMESHAWFI